MRPYLSGGRLAPRPAPWPWRAWKRLRELGHTQAHHAARLAAHTDLAVRFYVQQDNEGFERAYERACATAGGSLAGSGRAQILLDSLRTNLRVQRAFSLDDRDELRRELLAAVRAYESLLALLRRQLGEVESGAVAATRETEFDWLRWQLSVLCYNAALALAMAEEPEEVVARRVDEGVRHQPGLTGHFGWIWTWTEDWENARRHFAAAFAANPIEHRKLKKGGSEPYESPWRSHALYAAAQRSEQLGEPGAADAWQEAAASYRRHDPVTARSCLVKRARVLASDGRIGEALAAEEEAAGIAGGRADGSGETAAETDGEAPAAATGAGGETGPDPATASERTAEQANRAESHARRAVLQLELGKSGEAAAHLDAAVEQFRELPGVAKPHRQVVLAAEKLLTRPAARRSLRHEIQRRLAQAAEPALRHDLIGASRRLATLDASRFVSPPGPDGGQPTDAGAALPIAVEIRLDRISEEAVKGPLIESTGRLRESLEALFGVEMPGVHFRGITWSVAGIDYRILLLDIEVERGELPLEEGAAIVELLQRLRRLLISRLDRLVGQQETRTLLGRVVEFDTGETPPERQALDSVEPLTWLLKALLRERTSIAALDRIYTEFESLRSLGAAEESLVEAIRLLPEVRAELWGNGPLEPVLVPQAIESSLEEARRPAGGWSILVLEPAERDRLVAALVAAATADGGAADHRALVVRGGLLRPLVRGLIEEALPETPVLSLAELSPEREGALTGPPASGREVVDGG